MHVEEQRKDSGFNNTGQAEIAPSRREHHKTTVSASL
jgi:hypothetical protein